MITEVVVGEQVATEMQYDIYEIWLQFDSGDAEPILVDPKDILRVVNEWNAVIGMAGSEAESVIGQTDFCWPRHDNTGTLAELQGMDVYYYDVESRKRSVELR